MKLVENYKDSIKKTSKYGPGMIMVKKQINQKQNYEN
jgi:hypothetical protein